MSRLAQWEGDEFVVHDEFERDGKKIFYREVFSRISRHSFTQIVYEGEAGADLKVKVTIHAERATP